MWNNINNIIKNLNNPGKQVLINNISCLTFNLNNKTKYAILYLHGGAYLIRDISYYTILNKLSKSFKNCTCIYPKYTLNNPNQNIKEIETVINYLSLKKKKVILMGYSAGGHLCLNYYLNANKNKLILPYKMILISPWINPKEEINNSNDIIPLNIYNLISKFSFAPNLLIENLNIDFCDIFLLYGEKDLLKNQINKSKEFINYKKEYICKGFGHTFLYFVNENIINEIIYEIINFIKN